MEKVRGDYFEEDRRGDVKSVQERLAARSARIGIWENGRVEKPVARYEGVEDYDPVLASHCRLEPKKE